MEVSPFTLERYRRAELAGCATAIAFTADVPIANATQAAQRLHYEGWRRRHDIGWESKHLAELLPLGSLIRDRDGKYRLSYYNMAQNAMFWRAPESEYAGCPTGHLAYPITILDTP